MVARWLLPAGLAVLTVSLSAGPALHKYESVEPHMGTLVRVTVYTPDADAAKRAFSAAFDRIGELDRRLSDYRPDSELNRLAATAVGKAVSVSDDLFAVLRASQDLAEATDGAFDVTQGPVVRLWREARKTGRPPDAAALAAAASRSGFRKLRLDAVRRTVTLDAEGMALDVGAIGKGYAASEAIEALGTHGVRSALVAISGDLAFSEAPPGQRGWRISLPSTPADEGIPSVLVLTNAAVSTAGPSEQHLDAGGQRYSHIIDPASGMGLVGDTTVTVLAQNGLEADGLDTAISVVGPARGLALIESRPPAAALVVQRSGERTAVLTSARFRKIARGAAAPRDGR